MDEMINELICFSHGIDEDGKESRNIDDAIQYLSESMPTDIILYINNKEEHEKLKSDFETQFGEEHENEAMDILKQICLKILSMRKLVSNYPMIFVPLSFEKYQPKFMTKKSQRKHKLKRQLRRRQASISPKKCQKDKDKNGISHRKNRKLMTESINNQNINKIKSPGKNTNDEKHETDDDESLSELSVDDNDSLRDDNLNKKFNKIKKYPMKSKQSISIHGSEQEEEDKQDAMDANDEDEDDPIVIKTKSLPTDKQNRKGMAKHNTVPPKKRSKTRS